MRFPVPGSAGFEEVVPAPAPGPGNWVGASSAALDDDGSFVIAYRIRTADQRGSHLVIARSRDGVGLTTVATLDKHRFGAESLERPAILRTEAGPVAALRLVRNAGQQALVDRCGRRRRSG